MLFRNNTRDLMRNNRNNHRRHIREGIESPYKNIKTRIGRTVSVAVISDGEWYECPLEWGSVEFVAMDNDPRCVFPKSTKPSIDYDDFDDGKDGWHYDGIIQYIKKQYNAKKVYVVKAYEHSNVSYYISDYVDDGKRVYGFTWSDDYAGKELKQFWENEMTSWANGWDMHGARVFTHVSELDLLDNGKPIGEEQDVCDGIYYDGSDVKKLIGYVSNCVGKCDYYYIEDDYFDGLYDKNGNLVKKYK